LPLYLDKTSPSLRVIQALRDEAHRFGITHHRDRRSKSQTVSALDNIPGIGEKTKELLLKKFRSVARVKAATLPQLTDLLGPAKADTLFSALHPADSNDSK